MNDMNESRDLRINESDPKKNMMNKKNLKELKFIVYINHRNFIVKHVLFGTILCQLCDFWVSFLTCMCVRQNMLEELVLLVYGDSFHS